MSIMNALFIAYHSASFPIMESQGFSYLRGLSKQGINYSLLTFETKDSIVESCRRISELGMPVKWRYLFYHKRPRLLATALDIICGIFTVLFALKKDKITVIHARGVIPALIGFLPAKILGAKLFFDTRGLLADKYVGGGLLSQKSPTYRIIRRGEDFLLKRSDYFTVETHKHASVIRDCYNNGLSEKMGVIPSCVDTDKFYSLPKPYGHNGNARLGLVYVGRIGTWYLIAEMLDFFNVLSAHIPGLHFIFITHDDPGPLYSIARNKGINASKIAVKKIETGKIPAFLREAGAGISFINPYKRYNSSPIKFGEYLASGIPVIINSGIGDCDEIILKEKVGVIINDFSFGAYEKAAEELNLFLSEGEALRQRCVEAAKKHLSLEMGVNKYLDIYRRIKV